MHQVTSSLKELAELESSGRASKGLSTEEKLKRILKLRQRIPETVCGHYDRFVKAVNKVRSWHSASKKDEVEYLFVKSGISHEKIFTTDIVLTTNLTKI